MDGIAVMARNSGTIADELDPIHIVDQEVDLEGGESGDGHTGHLERIKL